MTVDGTNTSATGTAGGTVSGFKFCLDPNEVADLRTRLDATRWPDPETTGDWRQGVRQSWLMDLAHYWRSEFDWERFENRINQFPQFMTNIDGLDFHFLHVRSPHPAAAPLVLTHGWPGSIVEFLEVIPLLADPTIVGGDASDACHVVCPSLPGYGFSAKPAEPGWNTERIADAWVTLMDRLGYKSFLAQGGDWGSFITSALAVRHPSQVQGIHINMAMVAPDPATEAEMTEPEKQAIAAAAEFTRTGRGYSEIQKTRPQTIGYGLNDSPVAQLSWITDKFWAWTDHDGDPLSALSPDQMLDNVSLYWLTQTGGSSARLYWEAAERIGTGGYRQAEPVTVPSAITIFPRELAKPSRRWCERTFLDLRYYEHAPHGGHFAAFERPNTFVDQLVRAFRTMR